MKQENGSLPFWFNAVILGFFSRDYLLLDFFLGGVGEFSLQNWKDLQSNMKFAGHIYHE